MEQSPKLTPHEYQIAPETNLTQSEQDFLDEYSGQLDSLMQKIGARPGSELRGFFGQLFRPEAWRVLMKLRTAERLVEREMPSKRGQMALAQHEAEALNAEYDRRAAAVQRALQDFAAFVETANGRDTSTYVNDVNHSESSWR